MFGQPADLTSRRPTRSMTSTRSPSTSGPRSSRTTTRTLSTKPTPKPVLVEMPQNADADLDECRRRAADRRRDARRVVQLTLGLRCAAAKRCPRRSKPNPNFGRRRLELRVTADVTSRTGLPTATRGSRRRRRRTGTRSGSTRRRQSRPRTLIRRRSTCTWTTNGPPTASSWSSRVDEVEQIDAATETSVSQIFDPPFAGAPAESAPGSWAHAARPAKQRAPASTSTGASPRTTESPRSARGHRHGICPRRSRDRDRDRARVRRSKRSPRPRQTTSSRHGASPLNCRR